MNQKKELRWADLDDGLRRPNLKWKLGTAARWFAKTLPASLPDHQVKRDRNEAIGAVLLLLLLSGCSVLNNSEGYYKNRPYQSINYRTYQTD